MTWRYSQSTGQLWRHDVLEGHGYSGHGAGRNEPELQADPGVGPIPLGEYTIGQPLDPPDHLGPLAMPLTPLKATQTFGRSGFFIHGDNAAGDASASHGCIVLGRAIRQAIADSHDAGLEVII